MYNEVLNPNIKSFSYLELFTLIQLYEEFYD